MKLFIPFGPLVYPTSPSIPAILPLRFENGLCVVCMSLLSAPTAHVYVLPLSYVAVPPRRIQFPACSGVAEYASIPVRIPFLLPFKLAPPPTFPQQTTSSFPIGVQLTSLNLVAIGVP